MLQYWEVGATHAWLQLCTINCLSTFSQMTAAAVLGGGRHARMAAAHLYHAWVPTSVPPTAYQHPAT
jgi:hypothetical protein